MRVNVKGISGSGKTTFARELAGRLGVPYLELDAVHHIGPNWTEATPEQLQASAREFMAGAHDGWVIDGN
jgi:adenylate kinase family enzyme